MNPHQYMSCSLLVAVFAVSILLTACGADNHVSCATCYGTAYTMVSGRISTAVYYERCSGRWLWRRCNQRSRTVYSLTSWTNSRILAIQCSCSTILPTSSLPIESTQIKATVAITSTYDTSDNTCSTTSCFLLKPSISSLENTPNLPKNRSIQNGDDTAVVASVVVVLLVIVLVVAIIATILIVWVCFRKRRKSSDENAPAIQYHQGADGPMMMNVDGHYDMLHSDASSNMYALIEERRDDDNYEQPEPGTVVRSPHNNPVAYSGLGRCDQVYEEMSINSQQVDTLDDVTLNSRSASTAIYNVPRLGANGGSHHCPEVSKHTLQRTLDDTSNKQVYQNLTEDQDYENIPFQPPPSKLPDLYQCLVNMKCVEIQRKKLVFGSTLGSGEFGVVCKGEWLTPQGPREVALKVSHEDVPDTEKVKLLQEAAIMKQFRHPNVVRLLGTVTVSEPLILVLELLSNGSLYSFLSELSKTMNASRKKQFLKFSFQIAQGMKYLSNKGFVHRDLATRNILLNQNFVCKISDFGLSRNLDKSIYYVTSGGKIPLRWTAPEALFHRKYSSSSDVWSYGMTLFEVWSFGGRPFHALSVDQIIQIFGSRVDEDGHEPLLSCPKDCPTSIYKVMLQCWKMNHHNRPSFEGISHLLECQ